MLWWEMESCPTKKWGIGEKRLRTPDLEHLNQPHKVTNCFGKWAANHVGEKTPECSGCKDYTNAAIDIVEILQTQFGSM